MKKTYSKPTIAKSAVKLQRVTALVIATGPVDTAPNGGDINGAAPVTTE